MFMVVRKEVMAESDGGATNLWLRSSPTEFPMHSFGVFSLDVDEFEFDLGPA
jgi:hypothetical protein